MNFPWAATSAIIGVCLAVSVPVTTYFIRGIVRVVAEVKQDVHELRFKTLESDVEEVKDELTALRNEIKADFRRQFEKLEKIDRNRGCSE